MKRTLLVVLAVVVLISVGACAYVSPTLGRLPEGERLETIKTSPNYRDGQFQNQIDTPMRTNAFTFLFAVVRGQFEPHERPRPSLPLPIVKTDLLSLPRERDVVIWLGHSSYFVQIAGKRLLVDPVFSTYAAPLPGLVKAFDGTNVYTVQDMPDLDYILITHDHYDHLDYETVKDLEPTTRYVLAGLGVGAHLQYWGYPKEKVQEGDWYKTLELDPGLKVHVLPARHYSGRFMTRNQSLWVSFALETPSRRLFFSGDTGFGPHFEEIARRLGPFDLVALDAGQYNTRWANIHMNPEEAAQVAETLHARMLISGHDGKFSLARHPWDEPFERAVAASEGKSYRLQTPRIGEPVRLDEPSQRFEWWWRGIN